MWCQTIAFRCSACPCPLRSMYSQGSAWVFKKHGCRRPRRRRCVGKMARDQSIIYLAAVCDVDNMDVMPFILNAKNNSPMTNAIAKIAGPFASQSFDVITSPRVDSQIPEATSEFSCKRQVGVRVEFSSGWRQDDVKHHHVPFANQSLFLLLNRAPLFQCAL